MVTNDAKGFGEQFHAIYDFASNEKRRETAELALEDCDDEDIRLGEKYGSEEEIRTQVVERLVQAMKDGRLRAEMEKMLDEWDEYADNMPDFLSEVQMHDIWLVVTQGAILRVDKEDYAELVKAMVLDDGP